MVVCMACKDPNEEDACCCGRTLEVSVSLIGCWTATTSGWSSGMASPASCGHCYNVINMIPSIIK